jgi:anti-sigma-K factor RskA
MTHPEHETPLDLAPAYALGALSPEEARAFEAFLATSPEAQREVAEFRDVAALLALAGAADAPDPDLRHRVLERVGERKTRSLASRPAAAGPTRATAPRLVWGALAASLIAVLGLGAGLLSLRARVTELRQELVHREQTLARQQQALLEREATLNAILDPGVQMFQLTSSGDPEPGIQLFWNRQRNTAIVHGFRLKPVPAGRAYQLWFIKDGKPVPSVTFKPEPDGHAKVEQVSVPPDGDVSAAAITVEPEGGSPQPTSPILLVGPLKKS